MEFLCEYEFDVHYIKGKENVVADALSRRRHELSSVNTCTNLREKILHHFPADELYAKVSQMVHSQRPLKGKYSKYSLEFDGLLHHRGRMYVPSVGDLCKLIILEAHRAPYVVHPDVKKLYVDLKQLYHWLGMRA